MEKRQGWIILKIVILAVIIIGIQNLLAMVDWNDMRAEYECVMMIQFIKNLIFGFLTSVLLFNNFWVNFNLRKGYIIGLAIVFFFSVWNIIKIYIPAPEFLYNISEDTSIYFQFILGALIAQRFKCQI